MATTVRALLDAGRFKAASALTPESAWPYLLADLADRALRMELDTPMKPGLVGPDSVGAHKDMDYDIMRKGIAAIRPFFPRMAMAGTPEELRQLGIDAEKAMLAATGGVNTHRGAIFVRTMYAIEFLEVVIATVEDVVSACLYGDFLHRLGIMD